MIVAYVSGPYVRTVVQNAAGPEEDVVLSVRLAPAAVEWDFPRLIVLADGTRGPLVGVRSDVPVLQLDWPVGKTNGAPPSCRRGASFF